MKITATAFLIILLGLSSIRLHSQTAAPANSGAILLQMKAANDALIARQKASLEVLKAMEVDSNNIRIVAKRG